MPGLYLTETELGRFAQQSVANRCVSCVFWYESEPPNYTHDAKEHEHLCRAFGHGFDKCISYTGWCRRHAPIVVQGEDPDVAHWPLTDWDQKCGDYVNSQRVIMPFQESSCD